MYLLWPSSTTVWSVNRIAINVDLICSSAKCFILSCAFSGLTLLCLHFALCHLSTTSDYRPKTATVFRLWTNVSSLPICDRNLYHRDVPQIHPWTGLGSAFCYIICRFRIRSESMYVVWQILGIPLILCSHMVPLCWV